MVSTAVSSTEDYEGVLVSVDDAVCTDAFLGLGKWEVNDGSGTGRVDDLGYAFEPALGTTYAVTGPVACVDAGYAIEPRGAGADRLETSTSSRPASPHATNTTPSA